MRQNYLFLNDTDALAMGHEIYGEVVEIGDSVKGIEIGKK